MRLDKRLLGGAAALISEDDAELVVMVELLLDDVVVLSTLLGTIELLSTEVDALIELLDTDESTLEVYRLMKDATVLLELNESGILVDVKIV